MRATELPSPRTRSSSRLFLIGRNRHGNWVVQDPQQMRGGLFADRKEALKFALFENGNRPQAVVMVTGVLELDMSDRAGTARRLPHSTDALHARRAA
jgi:hypothetical protein